MSAPQHGPRRVLSRRFGTVIGTLDRETRFYIFVRLTATERVEKHSRYGDYVLEDLAPVVQFKKQQPRRRS